MATVIELISRTVQVTYVTDEGCVLVNAKGKLKVEPITARTSKIMWKDIPITDTEEVFYIQKSGSPTSGWITIGRATIMDSAFVDAYANNTMNRHDVEYYRILAPTSLYVIGIAKVEGFIDLYGAEIARRHSIILRRGLGGNKTYVFIKMRNGPRCPECWDEILQQRSRTQCETCDDTGYIGGYYNPIKTFVSFGPEPIAIQDELDGPTTAPDTVTAWTSNYPLLNISDMIYEPKGGRFWEVTQNNITMHKRVVTKQELSLVKQEGDDPVLRLIHRIPEEVDEYGQSIFQDDTPYR